MSENSVSVQSVPLKILHYEDKLKQVEAALAIDPSHDDLLTIKRDLQEILKILNSQVGENPEAPTEKGQTDTGEKVKAELDSAQDREEKKDLSDVPATSAFPPNKTIHLEDENQESADGKPETSNGTTTTTNVITLEVEDYIKFYEFEKMFRSSGQRPRRMGSNVNCLKLKQFISKLAPNQTYTLEQPITIIHKNFVDVSDRKLKNLLQRQKQKIKLLQINSTREAQGLPPLKRK